MTFSAALELMKAGRRVYRDAWRRSQHKYADSWCLRDGLMCIMDADIEGYCASFMTAPVSDVLADDWQEAP